MSYAFDELAEGGAHFEVRFAKPKPKDLPFFEHIWPTVQGKFAGEFEILRALLTEPAKAAAAVEEPPLPVSRERFLPQPLPRALAQRREKTSSSVSTYPPVRSGNDCCLREPTAGVDGYCSLMGQGREALLGVDALGMPAFSARSFGA